MEYLQGIGIVRYKELVGHSKIIAEDLKRNG